MFGPTNSSHLDMVQVKWHFGFVLLQLITSSLLMLMQLSIMPLFLIYADLRRRILYRITFGVYIVAWDHLIVQHFLLALNRLIIIVRAHYSPVSLFSGESSVEHRFFNFFHFLSWLIMFLLVVLLKKTRNAGVTTVVQVISNNPSQKQQGLLSVHEKRILLLSVLQFAIITALIFAWYNNYRSPPWTMLFCCYLLANFFLSLTMNSEYRSRFVQMIARLMPTFVLENCCGQMATNGMERAVGAQRNIMNRTGRVNDVEGLFIRRGHPVTAQGGTNGSNANRSQPQ